MVIKKSLEKYLEMCVLNLKYIFIKFLFKSFLTSSNIYICSSTVDLLLVMKRRVRI